VGFQPYEGVLSEKLSLSDDFIKVPEGLLYITVFIIMWTI
jgi:hypothetical protein